MSRNHQADISGERFGTFVAVAPTGERDLSNGSRVWVIRCDCGKERTACVSELRSRQARGFRVRCSCHAEFAKKQTARNVRRHVPARLRARGGFCWKCAGLAHRVVGDECISCGLRYAHEPPIEFPLPSVPSSAGRALDFAPGVVGIPRGGS